MILETDRLILREYVMEDFDALFEIVSDTETMQHYNNLTRGEAEKCLTLD